VAGKLRSCQFTDKQQLKAKMPAAGATQALRLFNTPFFSIWAPLKKVKRRAKTNTKYVYLDMNTHQYHT
jgi:hypothetical protein